MLAPARTGDGLMLPGPICHGCNMSGIDLFITSTVCIPKLCMPVPGKCSSSESDDSASGSFSRSCSNWIVFGLSRNDMFVFQDVQCK